MRIICREQHTAEWVSARVGKVTGSGIARAMAKLSRASGDKKRGDWAAAHDTYVRELAWELITRTPADHYVSKPMEIGSQYEAEACIEAWQATGFEMEQTGFVLHPTLDYFGVSPDRYFYDDSGSLCVLEVKVPLLKTHEQYLLDDVVPEEYVPQLQAGMCCLPAARGLFASYAPPDLYPELSEPFRLFLKWMEPDPAMHHEMEEAAAATMEHAVALVKQLTGRYLEAASHKSHRDIPTSRHISDLPPKPDAPASLDEVTDYIMSVTELERVP
jgi:hypothetical protein